MSGAPLRNWQNINIMKKYGPVAVVSICTGNSNNDSHSLPGVAIGYTYFISDTVNQSSIWKKIARRMWFLSHYAHSRAKQLYLNTIAKQLDKILKGFRPHLVIFEELWLYLYLPIVKKYPCSVVLDCHNIEMSLRREIKCLNRNLKIKQKIKYIIEINQIKAMEQSFMHHVDQIWVCSDKDNCLINTIYGNRRFIYTVPNGIDIAYYDDVRLGNCTSLKNLQLPGETIIFIGSFSYQPNAIAANVLIDHILPMLRGIYPECRLLLVGQNPTQHMVEMSKKNQNIVVTGRVQDVRPYLAASNAVVVPLLHGGGTRLKILEAFASGRPVVSTTKGSEGLMARNEKQIIIGNNHREIVEGICKLWSNKALSKEITRLAYDLACTEYSWEAVDRRINEAIQELC